jgi:hypothetical protein
MRRGIGCWIVVVVTGLAAAFPALYFRAHQAMRTVPAPAPPRLPGCLEAWVRLRSYRGCPVLAAAGGYRLGIYCTAAGWSNGAVAFAGPFPGRAYVSERPVPLGAWVHLAGIEASPSWIARPPAAPIPPAPAAIAFDGADVTAGRLFGQSSPLPLGYDPWEHRFEGRPAAARAAPPSGDRRRPPGGPGGRGSSGQPDGETGAWRLSRAGRNLAQVAAGRGSPWRLAALPPPGPAPQALPAAALPAGGPGRGITPRGWAILAAGELLALAMVGAGLALRRGAPGGPGGIDGPAAEPGAARPGEAPDRGGWDEPADPPDAGPPAAGPTPYIWA